MLTRFHKLPRDRACRNRVGSAVNAVTGTHGQHQRCRHPRAFHLHRHPHSLASPAQQPSCSRPSLAVCCPGPVPTRIAPLSSSCRFASCARSCPSSCLCMGVVDVLELDCVGCLPLVTAFTGSRQFWWLVLSPLLLDLRDHVVVVLDLLS